MCYSPTVLLAASMLWVQLFSTSWIPCIWHKCWFHCAAVRVLWHLEQQGAISWRCVPLLWLQAHAAVSHVAWWFQDNLIWWFKRAGEEEEGTCMSYVVWPSEPYALGSYISFETMVAYYETLKTKEGCLCGILWVGPRSVKDFSPLPGDGEV